MQAGGLVGDGDPEKLNIAESRGRGGQRGRTDRLGRTWRWGEGPCEEDAGCGPPLNFETPAFVQN